MTAVRYEVGAPNPSSHEFEVRIHVDQTLIDGDLILRLPAWIPGSYTVRDYARHVIDFSASADGKSLSVERLDKSSWRICKPSASVSISLTVYAWDLSVRGAHLDQHHAYFNAACLCPEVVGHTGPVEMSISPMPALPESVWVATAMRAVDTDERGFGLYQCTDYDELLDHPVEIADQVAVALEVAGVPHRLIIRGELEFDQARLAADCKRIFEIHHRLMGTPEDLDRYDVLAFAEVDTYGGLEHRWSTSLAISVGDLPQSGAAHNAENYTKLLGLISHEYFHLWNVRRLKPAAFEPLDLSGEVYTRLLWVFEGITSYFDDLALVRSGVISTGEYLTLLARILTRVQRTPGRHRQSLADSSFDAWTRFYKQDENAPNAIISYYAKGAVVALALDLKLRAETTTNLDEVMRVCWQRFYVDGTGMPETGLESVVNELGGVDFTPWFDAVIRGTDDPDIAPLLQLMGVEMSVRARTGSGDRGGVSNANAVSAYAGMTLASGTTRVANVIKGSPAQIAGLSAGDEIVAVDGFKASESIVEKHVDRSTPGTSVAMHVFRRSRLLALTVVLKEPPADTVALAALGDVSDAVMQRRSQWLWEPSDA
ncbi:MAG: PDZ domain-containing protein [Pseudomonadota bacterium]